MQQDHSGLGSEFKVERVVQVGDDKVPRAHMHPFYEVNFCLSGHSRFIFEDKTYGVSPGTLVFINPFISHINVRRNEYERIFLHLPTEMMRRISGFLGIVEISSLFGKRELVLDVGEERQEIGKLLLLIEEENKKKDAHYESRIQVLLGDMVIYLLRNIQALGVRDGDNANNTAIYNVAHYLSSHCSEPITLTFLSERFHIEKTYLCKKFRQVMGLTVWNYLIMQRIQKSCELLINTDGRIIDVAYACGFGTVAHFGRIFKKHIGCNPLQYRKKNLKANDGTF